MFSSQSDEFGCVVHPPEEFNYYLWTYPTGANWSESVLAADFRFKKTVDLIIACRGHHVPTSCFILFRFVKESLAIFVHVLNCPTSRLARSSPWVGFSSFIGHNLYLGLIRGQDTEGNTTISACTCPGHLQGRQSCSSDVRSG